MFKARLNTALALIKENIAYYIGIIVVVAIGVIACAVQGTTTGIITVLIIGLIAWLSADVAVYMNYIHDTVGFGSEEEDEEQD